ncbi:MAG: hypothetical protein M1358_20765, partial [Chloroflexi bacterium]|nr:hypothetical protein [Chloroflexota bacterium]
MRARAAWAGVMLIIFSLVLAAIGGVTSLGKAQPLFISTPTPVGAVTPTLEPTAPAVEPLKIGAVLAITGPNSS